MAALTESPLPPPRFEQHVGFDNLPVGEATKNNPSSFTLQARHRGYHPSRRSRTFMIGIDEHAYSDYALVWLLHNMVDDGDEVVCVRVVENPFRPGEKNYQEEAKRLLEAIQAKNELNKAISIILEYSVGKLHDTFQQLVRSDSLRGALVVRITDAVSHTQLGIYNPSMLVVGTKGRSLGGIQGLMNTRNSFSKYCLQYSPIPVVVVRPDDKRLKKKTKRSQDPGRQSYAAMLAYNAGRHEADNEASSVYEFERGISADEEAHRVAAAIGLPARFDPTIKPYTGPSSQRRRSSPVALASTRATSTSPPPVPLPADSGDEESGDDEDEFEVEAVSGNQLSPSEQKQNALERQQKERLHAMEVGEAAALLKSGKAEQLEDEDEDDDPQDRPVEMAPKS
jgi:nucleotide-binding universal stress UspA family protein